MARKKATDSDRRFEYITFSETLKSEELADMRSINKKAYNLILRNLNTAIISLKKETNPKFLVKFLGVNHDNSRNYLDLQKLAKEYETKSYTEAFAESLGTFFVNEVEEFSEVSFPDHPMLRRNFLNFQKELRDIRNNYKKLIAENEQLALDYSFGNVDTTEKMNEIQLKNREKMLQLRETSPDKFNILWVSGDYHLATVIARLENADYLETKLMREEILKRNEVSIEVKDYGLTITEILNGLQVAKKANERYLYKAFSEGNINLKAMILILRSSDLIEDEDKFTAIKTMQALSNDAGMYKITQDAERYVSIRRFIKKYNLPTHRNWKKDDQ